MAEVIITVIALLFISDPSHYPLINRVQDLAVKFCADLKNAAKIYETI